MSRMRVDFHNGFHAEMNEPTKKDVTISISFFKNCWKKSIFWGIFAIVYAIASIGSALVGRFFFDLFRELFAVLLMESLILLCVYCILCMAISVMLMILTLICYKKKDSHERDKSDAFGVGLSVFACFVNIGCLALNLILLML